MKNISDETSRERQIQMLIVSYLTINLGELVYSDTKKGPPFYLEFSHSKYKFHIKFFLSNSDMDDILNGHESILLEGVKFKILQQDPDCKFLEY